MLFLTGGEAPICTGLIAISVGLRVCTPNRCSVGCPAVQLCLHAALFGTHLHARLMPHFCVKGKRKKKNNPKNNTSIRGH